MAEKQYFRTKDSKEFVRWFPEISPYLFLHISGLRTLELDAGDRVFLYENPEFDKEKSE